MVTGTILLAAVLLTGGAPVTPADVAADRGGRVQYTVGTHGNALVRVGTRGRTSVVAVFPSRIVTAPPGTADRAPAGARIAMPAVPSSVALGPDGALYVGELTGFPYLPGYARVWRIVPGQRPAVFAGGFTTIIDLAWGPDRKLYVLEIAHRGLLSGDRTGALIRIDRPGKRTTLASAGLIAPDRLDIRGGQAYVTGASGVRRISLQRQAQP
jgi:hypothetical protein